MRLRPRESKLSSVKRSWKMRSLQFDDSFAAGAAESSRFLTARELVKAQLVFSHVQRGNVLLWRMPSRPQVAAEFRAALDLDGENEFARERLAEATRAISASALPQSPHRFALAGLSRESSSSPVAMGEPSFHYSGDIRGLFRRNWERLME